MITGNDIYWLTRLDDLKSIIVVIGAFSGVAGFIFAFIMHDIATSNKRLWIPIVIGILGCLLLASNIFIPSTKDMIMIKGLPAIINSDVVQKDLPEDTKAVYRLGVEYLKTKLTETKK
jgi:hypothetical protein